MENDILIWLGSQLIVGAAIWGGIRMDIRNMHRQIEQVHKTASDAHNRIDRILERK